MKTLIFGHKNPDTDSVCSAIAYSFLKNSLNENCEPKVLGDIKNEAAYVLDCFDFPHPQILTDVKSQVKDTPFYRSIPIDENNSYLKAFKTMESNSLNTIAITDSDNYLTGILSIRDISMELIKGDFKTLYSVFNNVVVQLEAEIFNSAELELDTSICGRISVATDYYKSLDSHYGEDDIVITGDTFPLIEKLISFKTGLLIICSDTVIPAEIIDAAKMNNVAMIQTQKDTYEVSKLIQQCNSVKNIMKKNDIVKLNFEDYLTDVRDEISNTNYRNYPIVDDDGKYLGFLDRRCLSDTSKKKVILVDHNEENQSVYGLNEAQILEIIDHHKLGGLTSIEPINFLNYPVGSTCTIIFQQFETNRVEIPANIAGILISGILSDTLSFKSPTCTRYDIMAVKELNKVANLNLDEHFSNMYKAACSTEGLTIEDLLYTDSKEFTNVNEKFRVSQFFTSDLTYIEENLDGILSKMKSESEKSNYFMYLLAVTDIIKEGSVIFYYCKNDNFISNAFGCDNSQGVFVENMVSRKKQIIPQILSELNNKM
ncbi:MAG: putative manganese-dependent inorganic diphosphatase [Proteocatella sp.]